MSLRVTFGTPLPSQWSLKMIRTPSLRLNQWFGPFTMSPAKGSSQTGPLCIYLSTSFVFGNFGNTSAFTVIFFWKCSKFEADSKNAEKNSEKMFSFWDKCPWIVSIQLSLLIREYLSSAVNVLRKRLKNFHVPKSDFCNSITFTMIPQDDKGALINIKSVLRSVYHVTCRGLLSNGTC